MIYSSRKSGFSLIEILIAVTILLIIVVMASMVFQQTTGAFQTGRRKVDSQTAIRNIMGMITRDLALAVDSDEYPSPLSGINHFSGTSIKFLALTGPRPKGEAEPGERNVQVIEYSYSSGVVTRKATPVKSSNGKWSLGSAGKSVYVNNPDTEALLSFEFIIEDDPAGTSLPSYVRIMAQIETKDSVSTVGAWSQGDKYDTRGKPIWVGVDGDME